MFLTSSPYDKTSYNAYSFFVGVDANLVPPKSGEGFDAIWDLALPNGASWQFMLFRVIRY